MSNEKGKTYWNHDLLSGAIRYHYFTKMVSSSKKDESIHDFLKRKYRDWRNRFDGTLAI